MIFHWASKLVDNNSKLDSTKELHSITFFSYSRFVAILEKALTVFEAFLQIDYSCWLKFSIESILTPNNFILWVIWTTMPFILIHNLMSSYRPMKISWNFSGFATSLLFSYQHIAAFMSLSMFKATESRFCPHAYIVLSSAKLYTWECCTS